MESRVGKDRVVKKVTDSMMSRLAESVDSGEFAFDIFPQNLVEVPISSHLSILIILFAELF
jgi:hypothetical protein